MSNQFDLLMTEVVKKSLLLQHLFVLFVYFESEWQTFSISYIAFFIINAFQVNLSSYLLNILQAKIFLDTIMNLVDTIRENL